jgi:hypothetical protein
MIDIGAVWCHWCHVMDATTYADPEVAATLNREFVPVKVDTDERPDLDEYYQNAAAQLTGAGGWPLTCFTTPNGALFLAAGYLPPRPGSGPHGSGGENSSMLPLLKRIAQVYAADRAGLEHEAAATAAKLQSLSNKNAPAPGGLDGLRAQMLAGLAASYNRESGGFASGPGPRFYDFPALELVLAHGFYGHPDYTAMALDTLKKIAAGGVFDQLGGGFHRYSTDPNWRVPHFEKLGYDNAMALRAYSHAYEVSGDPDFARVAESIAGYVNRDLLDAKTHAFYSHQDADSFKGDDGSYYTWTVAEVKHALPPDKAHVAILFYGMEDNPARAPDSRIVLRRAMTPEQLAAKLKIPVEQTRDKIAKASDAMLTARARRKTPPVDHAVMTDRNALMADAYLTASAALDDSSLQSTALSDLDFILAQMRAPDGSFFHVWPNGNGRAQVAGLVADQVYLLGALIDAYQFSANEKYLAEARKLSAIILKNFRDSSGLLVNRNTEDASTVIAQAAASAQVFFDMPTPSVQATMAIAAAKLALITGDDSYSKAANDLMASAPAMAGTMLSAAAATVGLALEYRANGDATVVIVGPPGEARAAALWRIALATYRPGKIVMRAGSDHAAAIPTAARAMVESSAAKGVPLAFVCAGTACATPVETSLKLAQVIRKFGVNGIDKTTLANDKPPPAR